MNLVDNRVAARGSDRVEDLHAVWTVKLAHRLGFSFQDRQRGRGGEQTRIQHLHRDALTIWGMGEKHRRSRAFPDHTF